MNQQPCVVSVDVLNIHTVCMLVHFFFLHCILVFRFRQSIVPLSTLFVESLEVSERKDLNAEIRIFIIVIIIFQQPITDDYCLPFKQASLF